MTLKKVVLIQIFALILFIFSLIEFNYRRLWVGPLINNEYDWIFFIILFLFFIFMALAINLIPKYMKTDLKLFENHPVIAGLKAKQLIPVWISFPITVIFEELLFRGLILVELSNLNGITQILAILLNAVIFSGYHIHIWFSFKDLKITIVFIFVSLLLGLMLGYFLFEIGLFGVIFMHWLFAFAIYFHISKKI